MRYCNAILTSASALAIALPARGVTQDTRRDQAKTHFDKAADFYEAGDFTAAITHLDSARRLDPRNPRIHIERGLALAGRAVRAGPPRFGVTHAQGSRYYRPASSPVATRDLDSAIADFTTAISLDSTFAEAYYHRAHAHARRGHLERAVHDFTKAIATPALKAWALPLAAVAPFSYNDRGLAFEDLEMRDRALLDYSSAIDAQRRRPMPAEYTEYSASPYSNRARLLADKRDVEHAISDFEIVLTLARDPETRRQAQEYLKSLRGP